MTAPSGITRRHFLQISVTAAGGLLVGAAVGIWSASDEHSRPPAAAHQPVTTTSTTAAHAVDGSGASFVPSLFVRIDPDDKVTLTVHRSEMGQGVRTALAMVLAEELEVDLAAVHVEQAPADKAIGNQLTSGSGSIEGSFDLLRAAGATAREILVSAAAVDLGVDVARLRATKGTVMRVDTGDARTYGQLVAVARTIELAGSPRLKDPMDFHVIGTSAPRVGDLDIVTGKAVFGLDTRVPRMLFAVVARCPVPGGTVRSFDDAAAKAVRGVRHVVRITSGVAVVADTTWAALQGRNALTVATDEGDRASLSSTTIRQTIMGVLQPRIDLEGPLPAGAIEAFYETPYQAHATMEPQNCVADVRANVCEVWAPTQNPQDVQSYVQKAVGRPTQVHVTNMGGGFGRRLQVDFALEAAETSKAVGAPVQVVWTREDDTRHDFYCPPTVHWLRAQADATGRITLWRHLVAGPGFNSTIYQLGRELLKEGLDVPYAIADSASTPLLADIPLPTGPWRAVSDGPNAFANECFLDEMAAVLQRNPLQLRMDLLGDSDPMKATLALAAAEGQWAAAVPAGRGRGIACHQRGATPVAMVAEVSVAGGEVTVHKIVCAVDCGRVVHPDIVAQQMESGVAFALTAMLKSSITFDRGRVVQGNFDSFPLLQLREMPEVSVHIVPSTRAPSGVGEMGVPPVAPAVANAVFAVTGKRIRRLPVQPTDL